MGLVLATGCGGPVHVPIVLWHSVGNGSDPRDVYDLTPSEFEEQLILITSTFHAKAITLTQYFDALEGRAKFPNKALVLTFDDGRRCLFTEVYPLLKKYGLVAENFVVTGFLGENELTRKRTANQTYLIWPEVIEMDQSGVMLAESHGLTHIRLRTSERMTQHREVFGSRMTLDRRLGRKPSFFAYPYGSFSPTTRELVEKAGYRGAVSVARASGTAYDLHRVSLRRNSTPLLRAALEQAFGRPPK